MINLLERREQIEVENLSARKSKMEFLLHHRSMIQADLDLVDSQIAALQADVALLEVEYQPTLAKVAEEMASKEPIAEKV